MSFPFIADLAESRLIPSRTSLNGWKTSTLRDLCYLYVLSLCVLMHHDATRAWAKQYCHSAGENTDFSSWRTSANDLYAMLYAVSRDEDIFPTAHMRRWLRNPVHHDRALLVRLDGWFHIRDAQMKAVRREITDWDGLDPRIQQSIVRKLAQWIHDRAHSSSELLPHLKRLINLEESATAGATSVASVATSVGGLGSGFDPNGDRGVYQKAKLVKRPSDAKTS